MGDLTGTQKAAALHGVAINRAYSQAERLAAAVQALDIYEQEYDALKAKQDRPSLYGPVPPVEVPDELAEKLAEELGIGTFPVDAWKEIFSRVPAYPLDLPDDVVCTIADLAIHVRQLAENLGKAVESGDRLLIYMGPSLISSCMKKINQYIEAEIERGGF